MHRPETWGYVQFTSKTDGTTKFIPDETDPARQLLHRVYYAQKAFRKANKRWAKSLAELKLGPLSHASLAEAVKLDVGERDYTATARVKTKSGAIRVLRIRGDSRVEVR